MKQGSNVAQSSAQIKVGLADDHLGLINLFARLINSQPDMRFVVHATDGIQLLALLKSTTELPDILFMDVGMERMDGIEATKIVRNLYPTIKTVAFSDKKDERTILAMIRSGACAYLSKQLSDDQWLEAIRELYRKGKYHADLYHLHSAKLRQYSNAIGNISFTDKEKWFIQLTCKGLEHNQIADAMGVTEDAVYYYKRCIRDKLGTRSYAVMIFVAIHLGIVSPDEEWWR